MHECSFCGIECDSSIGLSRELTSVYWGGKRHGNVEKSPRLVTFFCTDQHRNDFIADKVPGGEVQTDRWDKNDD